MMRTTKRGIYTNLAVIAMFVLVTALCTSYFFKSKLLMISGDGYFHFSQAEEIYQNLRHGVPFTFIATHTFNSTGVGNFLFYPTVFLYPWAVLRFFFSAITAYNLWYAGLLLGTFIIAYYCMLDYSRSSSRGVFFALLYGLAPYHLYTGNYNFVLGEYIMYTFLPIAFLGFYHVFKGDYRKWPLLAIGITLILYSHLLSAYMTVGIFIVILVGGLFSSWKWYGKERIIALIKSIILTISLSIWFFVPFLTDFIKGGVVPPEKKLIFYPSLSQSIISSLTTGGVVWGRTIGLLGVVTIVIGWYFVRPSIKERIVYSLEILTFIASTAVIPYTKIELIKPLFEVLGLIQLPCRFLNFASLFLAITGSLIITRLIREAKFTRSKVGISLGTIILILGYFTSINVVSLNTRAHRSNFLKPCTTVSVDWSKNANVVVNNRNYNNIFTYPPQFGSTDYYLRAACNTHSSYLYKDNISPGYITDKMISIEQHNIFVNGHKKIINPIIGPNKLTYHVDLKRSATVDLPVIAYHNTLAYDNGRRISKRISNRGTINVRLRKGSHSITAQYTPNKLYFVAVFIAAFTWVALLVTLITRHFGMI